MRLYFLVPCLSLGILVLLTGIRYGSAISPTDSLGRNNVFIKLPFFIILLSRESQGATVWIPEDPPAGSDGEGSVLDEYAEVAHVFAKPDAKLVKVKPEDATSEQAVPWTSLNQEWELYKKYHKSDKKSEDSDSEEADEEDYEEEDEQDQKRDESLPIAFYGQQNADDDEKEYAQNQKRLNQKTKKVVPPITSDESEEEDDTQSYEVQADVADGPNDNSQDQAQQADPSADSHGVEDLPDDVREAMYEEMKKREIPEESYDESEDEEDDEDAGSPIVRNTKGDEDDLQDDEGGKGKDKGKGKKKKKKKKKKGGGGQGWGWKKPQVIYVPTDSGHGWKKGHNGILEQMVKGSTWERILNYYHSQNDEQEKHGHGWHNQKDTSTKLHETGQGLADKLFKGSFWERAVMTYGQYRRNHLGKPAKEMGEPPLSIEW